MKITLHLRCRSFRDLLIFLLSFSLLSLYVTYQLGTLPITKSIPQDSSDILDVNWLKNVESGDSVDVISTNGQNNSRILDLRQKLRRLLIQIENQHLFALKNVSKVAMVYGKQNILERELPFYQDLLLRHEFTMKVPSTSFLVEQPDIPNDSSKIKNHDKPTLKSTFHLNWWLLLCLTDGENSMEECLPKESYPLLQPYQKINQIPGLQNLLLNTEALCTTFNTARKIAAMKKRYISPICFLIPDQCDRFQSVADALGDDVQWIIKRLHRSRQTELLPTIDHKLQLQLDQFDRGHPAMIQQFFPNPFLVFGSPVSLRVYVVVSSILPLRVYLFNEGLVNFRYDHRVGFKKVPGRMWMVSQLWHYIASNYGQQMVRTAILNMQQAIVQTLLFTEIFLVSHFASFSSSNSKNKYRCEHCFQLLEFELIFNSTFHPVILEVNGRPTMQEQSREDGLTGEKVRRSLISSMLDLLFSVTSVAEDVAKVLEFLLDDIGLIGINCQLSHNLCLTNEDLKYLLDSRRESLNKGGFRQIYPSFGMEQHSILLSELDNVMLSQRSTSVILPNSFPSRGTEWHSTARLHELLSRIERLYSRRNNNEYDSWLDPNSLSSGLTDEDSILSNSDRLNAEASALNPPGQIPKCSEDPSTLPYVRSIHTDPSIDLSPPFSPAVMDYYTNVSYDQLMIKVWAFALNCQSEARLDEKFGTSQPANYTLGIGDNRISFVVVDIRHSEPWVINTYTLTVHRHSVTENEPTFDEIVHGDVCSLKQECELRVSPLEPCGLQKELRFMTWTDFLSHQNTLPLCDQGDSYGRWVLPCKSCSRRSTCVWSRAIWSPFHCQHGYINRQNLSRCLDGKKVLFIGDSTNRGIMHYLMERLNGTLTEWDKTHNLKVYTNVNDGRTTISFAYYPQFWLPTSERPVFEKALYQLIQKSRPLSNDSKTILIVGGVHWLATQHLHMLLRALKREGLAGIRLVMKTLGSGFHLPVDGVHSLTKSEHRKLLLHSMGLAEFARHYNFEVIDTFNVTIPRYKDFLQGKCACHFHKVVPLEANVEQPPYAVNQSPTFWIFGGASGGGSGGIGTNNGGTKEYRYHVEGTVNAIYSEILISRLCPQYRN